MSLVLCMFCVILIPLAFAGLALIQQGLGRSRSAAHTMLNICVLAITAIIFVAFGFSWAGIAGGLAHSFTVRGSSWNWIGALPLFSQGVKSRVAGRAGAVFSNVCGGSSWDNPDRNCNWALAISCNLFVERSAGGDYLSAVLALGMGRRLAFSTRFALRAGHRLCGCRRKRNYSCGGRYRGSGHGLDCWPSLRKVRG